ncbi:MAG: nucleotide exchange factor GrpE [Caulobacterales bacterium 68-7]|nr:nucleotide exchange factor GrpE [Caulobacterales bacterium]OJU12722.1 MAG: nucleotide exchange factor GrpE [Caulobacterales bacterium 68-7]
MTDDQTPANQDIEADLDAAELEALRAEVAALKEQTLRYAAEAENTKRRAEREANDARAYAIQKFARDLLGAADALERALAAAPKDSGNEALTALATGVEMTEKTLQQAFDRNGLKKVAPPKGSKFDPHLHQAMMEQPSTEVAAGGVIQTLQTGYELFGRIVRPAMVVVAAKGSTGEAVAEPTAAANPYAGQSGDDSVHEVDTKA